MTTATSVGDRHDERVADRYRARRVLWADSTRERLRDCGRVPVSPGGGVMLRRSSSAGVPSAGYAGLASCGSVWACPVCSARIAHQRQGEVEEAIRSWQAAGGEVLMVTLTMRHARKHRLGTLWENLSYAWNATASGRGWAADKASYGVQGWLRVVEVTHGTRAGWHLHVHALVFVDDSGQLPFRECLGIGYSMFQRWRDALVRRGMAAPQAARGGMHVRLVDHPSIAADYFTKQTYDGPARAALEATRGDLKDARWDNRTPFAILRAIVDDGQVDDLELWHEYEQASAGRRQLLWSRGFRARVCLEPEVSDQDIVDEDHGGHDVVLLPRETFDRLTRSATDHLLLAVARAGGDDGQDVKEWLRDRGLVWLDPPDAPPRRRR